ncbi:hypothetical protein Bca4012_021051 [Brassica carinata]
MELLRRLGQCYYSEVMEWPGTNEVSLFLSGLILALDTVKGFSETSHELSSDGWCLFVGSVFCIFWYKTCNLLLLEAFESSLLPQLYVSGCICIYASFLPNWFRDDR